jgi:predicted RNase H-like nuclease (RuvC/YqgF family)
MLVEKEVTIQSSTIERLRERLAEKQTEMERMSRDGFGLEQVGMMKGEQGRGGDEGMFAISKVDAVKETQEDSEHQLLRSSTLKLLLGMGA